MKTRDETLGRRELGGDRYVVVKRAACGALYYGAMNVSPNWDEAPLNRCDCGKPLIRWTAAVGHICEACGPVCNRTCVSQ